MILLSQEIYQFLLNTLSLLASTACVVKNSTGSPRGGPGDAGGVLHAALQSVLRMDHVPNFERFFFLLLHFSQDEARMQKITKRMNTLEEVNNNVRLLNEMLAHYCKDDSTEGDKELMMVTLTSPPHFKPRHHSVVQIQFSNLDPQTLLAQQTHKQPLV